MKFGLMERMMKTGRAAAAASTLVLAATVSLGLAASADAAPRHKGHVAASHARTYHGGVRFAQTSRGRGGSALVSDGPGTGFGFHRLPGPFRVGAAIHRDRQADALRETVAIDSLTHGSYRSGFLGDSEPASGPYATYGVYNGPDGYGSPYFAGYYGEGGGEDLGPLGHTYE